jgi:Ferritin-like
VIRLALEKTPANVDDARAMLQKAIGVEFGTLPPYLYALYSIRPGANEEARRRIKSVALQEMTHMCLACNILNALGGSPAVAAQTYPGPLPGDIGPDGTPLTLHLYPFSQAAMKQAMDIEQPEDPPDIPVARLLTERMAVPAVTIGQFYGMLDAFLATLPANVWQAGRSQVVDDQFFGGQLFAVNRYEDAHRAISDIVSEGEGTKNDPLDFRDEVAHYYRFGELYHDRVLTKAANPFGYSWGPARLGIDWAGVYPAIADPGQHDFSQESAAAQAAQTACNAAFTDLVNDLQNAVTGKGTGSLGQAVAAMYQLRTAALHAFTVPLEDGQHVSGPAFLYQP